MVRTAKPTQIGSHAALSSGTRRELGESVQMEASTHLSSSAILPFISCICESWRALASACVLRRSSKIPCSFGLPLRIEIIVAHARPGEEREKGRAGRGVAGSGG
eukprot:scaffold148994_cov31-Tisochrysis_lutea.AAC.1